MGKNWCRKSKNVDVKKNGVKSKNIGVKKISVKNKNILFVVKLTGTVLYNLFKFLNATCIFKNLKFQHQKWNNRTRKNGNFV